MTKTEINTKANLKTKKDNKNTKQYQKPHIVHTKEIETLAGSCSAGAGCPIVSAT
jgi:hypothetical protein